MQKISSFLGWGWIYIYSSTPNAGKEVERVNLSYIAGGNVKWYSHCRKSLAVSLKISNILIIQLSNCIPGFLCWKNKNLCLHKNMHMIVHSSLICNSQKLKTTKMSFSGSIVEWWSICTMKYLSAMKGANLIFSVTWMDLNEVHYDKWKQASLRRLHSVWFYL